jgi:hypothetical protein
VSFSDCAGLDFEGGLPSPDEGRDALLDAGFEVVEEWSPDVPEDVVTIGPFTYYESWYDPGE